MKRAYKVTTDTLTGKAFRWNGTIRSEGLVVPSYETEREMRWLHPGRVPVDLLRELNA